MDPVGNTQIARVRRHEVRRGIGPVIAEGVGRIAAVVVLQSVNQVAGVRRKRNVADDLQRVGMLPARGIRAAVAQPPVDRNTRPAAFQQLTAERGVEDMRGRTDTVVDRGRAHGLEARAGLGPHVGGRVLGAERVVVPRVARKRVGVEAQVGRTDVRVGTDQVRLPPRAGVRPAVARAPVDVHVEERQCSVERRVERRRGRSEIGRDRQVLDADGGGDHEVRRDVNPVQYSPAPTAAVIVVVVQDVIPRKIDSRGGQLGRCEFKRLRVVVVPAMEEDRVVHPRVQVVESQPLFAVAVGIATIVGKHRLRCVEIRAVPGLVAGAGRHGKPDRMRTVHGSPVEPEHGRFEQERGMGAIP